MSALQPLAGKAGYPAISGHLRAEILSGARAVGSRLPALTDLATKYQTTPVTVRRALRELEGEGLVSVNHGVGTFVADWHGRFDLLALPGLAGQVTTGHVETRILPPALDDAERAAAALGLSVRPPAITRLRLLSGRPVALQTSYAVPLAAPLLSAYRPEQSLYAVLAGAGLVPHAGVERLEAVGLPSGPAAALGVAPGAPGWRSTRLTLDASQQPLLYDDAWLPGERVALWVRRQGRETRLEFDFTETQL